MKITERAWYAIVFMLLITLAASTILIIFGNTTRQRVEDNQRVAFRRAVLEALPVKLPSSLTPAAVHRIFLDSVYQSSQYADVLEFRRNDSIIAYALPVEGPGFWAPIRGIIGIGADRMTLTGLAIYEQNETPGLGGEIIKPDFRDQFRGKRIADDAVPVEIRQPAEELDEHSVHAITGATQTSTKLGILLNARLKTWRDARTEASP